MGHSFGGALVRLYAHDFPEDVAAMVLVDAASDDLFIRIPAWRKAIEQKLRFYRLLAHVSSSGLLALAPEETPNRGLPDAALAQYRLIWVATQYYQTNMAETRTKGIASFGDMPIRVLSRGYWEPVPGLSEAENHQAWKAWRDMQAGLTSLSSSSKQVIAEQSEHFIKFLRPQMVIDAIQDIESAVRNAGHWIR